MKVSLKLRFIVSFFLLSVIVITILNTYGKTTIYHKLIEQEKEHLFNEASLIANEYIPDTDLDFSKKELETIRRHFISLQTLTDMRTWLVTEAGMIIVDSDRKASCQNKNIKRYDASFLSNQSLTGCYPEGMMQESMITVIHPITKSLQTEGYIILMLPESNMEKNAASYIDTIVICYFILLACTAILLTVLYFQTSRPIKAITRITRQYADGHYNTPLKKPTSKEMAELNSSIQYLSEKMQLLIEYQKKFIANVSHDFRSPLTSIKGYTEALADGTIPAEMQEKYFGIILFEVERLHKLTSNLLELNELEHGSMILEPADFDINLAVRKVAATFEQRCSEKKLIIELSFDSRELYVHADLNKIQQVLQNLIDNAIKFSLSDSAIEIHTSLQNHKVFVSVRDYGIGIPKDSIPKVWNRFYKTDLSRGKDKTGTGLGLSIVKEIIDAHGENINIISTEGVGTEFIFTLPKYQEPEEN